MLNLFLPTSARKLLVLAAAGMAVATFVPRVSAGDPGAQPTDSGATASLPQLPDGFATKDEKGFDSIQSTLASLTQRAVTKDSYDSFFSGFLSDLASRDKERAREFKGVDQKHLNDIITQIQAAWKTKYGQDFDATEKNLALDNRYPIIQGEVSDPTVAITAWPVAPGGQAITASSSNDQQQSNSKELTKGREVAIVRLPADDHLPGLTVSLLHQTMTGWHVDVPVDRTGEQIYNDLTSHLNYIATNQQLWPNNVTDGYRMVTRHIVAAVYGVSSTGGAQ